MSLYSEYLAAAIPPPFTILGVTLRPYSLGHKMVLGRINSPFEIGGIAGVSDIVLAVLICSNDYSGAVELLDRADLAEQCHKWAMRLQVQGRWPRRKLVEIDWIEKRKMFNDYIAAHSKEPVISFDESKFSEGAQTCPTLQLVKVDLMHKLGLSETEALNRSWSLCLWDYYTLRVLSGSVRMVDREAEGELIRRAKEAA